MQVFGEKYFYFCRMIFSETTGEAAGIDFAKNVWPHLFPGKRGSRNREFMRVRAFVKKVEDGGASPEWTARILKQYGGDRYRITTKFEIKEI